jgi:hypothetical protein
MISLFCFLDFLSNSVAYSNAVILPDGAVFFRINNILHQGEDDYLISLGIDV